MPDPNQLHPTRVSLDEFRDYEFHDNEFYDNKFRDPTLDTEF